MAISTSSTSVALPGLDTTFVSNMDAALNASSVMLNILLNSNTSVGLAALTTTVATLRSKISDLPNSNPLPTFATFANYNNTPGWGIYDSEMQPIGGTNGSTDFEIQNDYTGQNYTTNNWSSNGVTNSWSGATPMHQQDGDWYCNIPGRGFEGEGIWARNRGTMDSYMPYFGSIIGNRGVRQKMSLRSADANLQIMPRGASNRTEEVSLNNTIYSTWANGVTYGNVSYNQRQKKLVLIEAKDGSNNYRVHIWRNTNALRDLNSEDQSVGTLHLFLSEAKTAGVPAATTTGVYYYYNDFQWQNDASQNYTESRYRMRVTAGDNEFIGMSRFVPSTATHYATFLPTINTTSGTLSYKGNPLPPTTSYGWDQGVQYGMRSNITWDNYWMVSYNPYYYYGSGMCAVFVDTRDPRNYYFARYGETNNGCQLVPFNEDKFVFNASVENSDGNVGMRLSIVDLGGIFEFGRDATTSGITNGANINLRPTTMLYSFDTRFTSTNYPGLMQPTSWTNG
jgi:hypothetical protein